MDPNLKKPALIAGAVSGVLVGLSTIINAIPFLNIIALPATCICCFAIPIGTGILAVKLLSNATGGRGVTPADGAMLGAIAGAISAAIYLIVAIPLHLLMGALAVGLSNNTGDAAAAQGLVFLTGIFGKIISSVFMIALSAGGGAIGSAIFKGPMPPVPPPSYPTPPGPGGYGGPQY